MDIKTASRIANLDRTEILSAYAAAVHAAWRTADAAGNGFEIDAEPGDLAIGATGSGCDDLAVILRNGRLLASCEHWCCDITDAIAAELA